MAVSPLNTEEYASGNIRIFSGETDDNPFPFCGFA